MDIKSNGVGNEYEIPNCVSSNRVKKLKMKHTYNLTDQCMDIYDI